MAFFEDVTKCEHISAVYLIYTFGILPAYNLLEQGKTHGKRLQDVYFRSGSMCHLLFIVHCIVAASAVAVHDRRLWLVLVQHLRQREQLACSHTICGIREITGPGRTYGYI